MPFRRLLLFFLSSPFFAQAQDYFQKTYDYGAPAGHTLYMAVAPDGIIYLLAPALSSPDSSAQTRFTILDKQGEPIWNCLLASELPVGTCLSCHSSGNYFIGLSPTNPDIYHAISVYNNSFNSAWLTPLAVPPGLQVKQIVPLTDTSCIALASRPGPDAISSIFRINRVFVQPWEITWTDGQDIAFLDLALSASGFLYAVGTRNTAFGEQSILVKLTTDGAVLWTKTLENVSVRKLHADAADNIWLGGPGPSTSRQDMLIQKLDSAGNFIWSKRYATPKGSLELTDFAGMANGDMVVSCQDPALETSNTALLRISPAGTLLWAQKYAPSRRIDHLLAVGSDASGDLIAAGLTGEDPEHLQPWVIRTDKSGDIPDCCLASYPLEVNDHTPLPAIPSTWLTTSILSMLSGGLGYEELPAPKIAPLCDHLRLPNAFTPNGDRINDRFLPNFTCPPETIRFAVYNRWGNTVFETTDPTTYGWDGNFNGQPAPADVYGWLLEYDTFADGKTETKREKGEITLLR